mgnify:CR=1 FL=1
MGVRVAAPHHLALVLEDLHVIDPGQSAEFLELRYADGDKLYVPVHALDLISRYTGAAPENAPLHRLGSDQWARARKRAISKIRDVAAELLDVYARRAARPGHSFRWAESDYRAFESDFPFEPTEDQARTIDEVLAEVVDELQEQADQLATPLRKTFTGHPLPSRKEVVKMIELLQSVISYLSGYVQHRIQHSATCNCRDTLHQVAQLAEAAGVRQGAIAGQAPGGWRSMRLAAAN